MSDKDTRPYRPCVGVMLVNRDGLVFVGERLDTPDAWQMPQGGIDKGEDPQDAALRELAEETGVSATMVSVMGGTGGWLAYDLPEDISRRIWKGRYRGQKQKWYALRFHGRDSDIDLDATHAEFRAWRWVLPKELPGLAVPFKRDIYETVVKRLGPLIDG